jgi:hypothetical protein
MHYLSDGQWLESKEEIELFQDGALARQGQHKVVFAPNLKTRGGIELLTPDGKRFRSHIFGLIYYDSASGKSTLLAETKDSVGQLVAPNRVVYVDAFDDIQADVQFTYQIGSFEQDVVLVQNVPSPLDYGMNPKTTRLQVWSEFIEAPVPEQRATVLREESDPVARQALTEPDLTDAHLDFGAFYIGAGRAFALEGQDDDSAPSVQVAKEWATVEGRQFLIESVELPEIKPLLDQLPAAAALAPANPNNNVAGRRKVVGTRSELLAQANRPDQRPRAGGKIQMAQLTPRKRAVVLDYVTLSSGQNNYVFKGDTTYLIDNQVTRICRAASSVHQRRVLHGMRNTSLCFVPNGVGRSD